MQSSTVNFVLYFYFGTQFLNEAIKRTALRRTNVGCRDDSKFPSSLSQCAQLRFQQAQPAPFHKGTQEVNIVGCSNFRPDFAN